MYPSVSVYLRVFTRVEFAVVGPWLRLSVGLTAAFCSDYFLERWRWLCFSSLLEVADSQTFSLHHAQPCVVKIQISLEDFSLVGLWQCAKKMGKHTYL